MTVQFTERIGRTGSLEPSGPMPGREAGRQRAQRRPACRRTSADTVGSSGRHVASADHFCSRHRSRHVPVRRLDPRHAAIPPLAARALVLSMQNTEQPSRAAGPRSGFRL
jgi:hypothetical protein